MVVEPGELDSLAWAFVLAYLILSVVYVTPFVLAATFWWRSLRERIPGAARVPTVAVALGAPALAASAARISLAVAAVLWAIAAFATVAGMVARLVTFARGRLAARGAP